MRWASAVALAAVVALATACSSSTEPNGRVAAPPQPVTVTPPPPSSTVPLPSWPASVGTEQIYVANADGTGVTRLTIGGWPVWSPDGRRIAFHRGGEIFVIGVDGGGLTRVAAGITPTWSPDGARIAFASALGISVANADGSTTDATQVRTLVAHGFRTDTYKPWDMGVGTPAWSPDGAHIAFAHLGDSDVQPAQIYVMNADGSDVRRLTDHAEHRRYAESDPSWTPDGATVALWSYGDGIATVDQRGGEPRSLYADFPTVAYGARPVVSPDGRTVLFNTFPYGGAPAVWAVSPATGVANRLIGDAYQAAWAPDGARIAFVSRREP